MSLLAAWTISLLVIFLPAAEARAFDPGRPTLSGEDVLAPGGRAAKSDVLLTGSVLSLWNRPIGGEIVRFLLDGKMVGRAMTGGDGHARWTLPRLAEGVYLLEAVSVKSARVEEASCLVVVAVWPPESPLLLVNLNTILPAENRTVDSLRQGNEEWVPPRGAVQALSALARRFRIVYLATRPATEIERIRSRMKRYQFPAGPIIGIRGGRGSRALEEALDGRIADLKSDGWTNVAAGIGGTLDDALAFSNQGVKAVILSDRVEKEDLPAGAHKAGSWDTMLKEFR